MIIQLAGDSEAKLLATRLVSVKHIWELWAQGATYEEVHEQSRSEKAKELWVSKPFSPLDETVSESSLTSPLLVDSPLMLKIEIVHGSSQSPVTIERSPYQSRSKRSILSATWLFLVIST